MKQYCNWTKAEVLVHCFKVPKITYCNKLKKQIKTTTDWKPGKWDRGWIDGSVVTSTCSTSRGPGFSVQHPQDSSQPSVSPDSDDPMPSSGLHKYCTYITQTYIKAKYPYT